MAGIMLVIGYCLTKTGSFAWITPTPELRRWIWRLLIHSVLLATFLEVFFRGIVMGIFLRAHRPAIALLAAAIFSTLFQIAFHPSAAVGVPDPEALLAGVHFLTSQFSRLVSPIALVAELIPVFCTGFLFAYARWRTGSLWLPVGLHTGWIFANELFMRIATPIERKDWFARLLAGDGLQHGLLPLIGIGLTTMLVHFLISHHAENSPPAA